MNVGSIICGEHMPDEARVHYAYADAGGTAPNVVPAHAVIKYEVRAPTVDQVQELFERVVNIAQGAALMTQTQMRWEITMAFSDYVPNRTLAEVVDQCLEIGAPVWTEADYRLAAQFLQTWPGTDPPGNGQSFGAVSHRGGAGELGAAAAGQQSSPL